MPRTPQPPERKPDDAAPENELELSARELEDAEARSSVRVHVVHEAVRREGEEELKRPSRAACLWWRL